MNYPFVIFDRDGTLIDHIHHLVDPDLIRFKDDIYEALSLLKEAKFRFGIISNQSVIQRGLASDSDVQGINAKILDYLVTFQVIFDFVYYCPHSPSQSCKCRKPEIGLGLKAIREHGLNPVQSYMVGDQEVDMKFGKNLGCRTIQILGNAEKSPYADYHSESLMCAAEWILANG